MWGSRNGPAPFSYGDLNDSTSLQTLLEKDKRMDRTKLTSRRSKVPGVRGLDKISNSKRAGGSIEKITVKAWDFKTLDQEIKFKNRDIRKQAAKKLGYHYITEAIVKLYRKHQSSYKVGALMNVASVSILKTLERIGEPKNKRGSRRRG